MRVLLFENDLLWSVRLSNGLTALGHEPTVIAAMPDTVPAAELAIVNLGSAAFNPHALVPMLHQAGIKVVGHAGHSEKARHQEGRSAGVDALVTNGSLANDLEATLAKVAPGL